MFDIKKTQIDGKQDVKIIAQNRPEVIYDDTKFQVFYSICDSGSRIVFRVVPILVDKQSSEVEKK